jgi:type II secretory pathway pseudopilin PulG
MPDIYLHLGGQQAGPYQPAQLRQLLVEGKATAETPAWYQGLKDWTTAAKVLAAFPVDGAPPVYIPPPPPPPAIKKGTSGWVIAVIIICACMGVPTIACLAGIALGPITAGIQKAKESASMQSSRAIALAMYTYALDHNGAYPDGASSTEVFQKLIDGKYVSDPSLFYFQMEGKTKATSNKLAPENVCYDVTSGVTSNSSDLVPVVFTTGYILNYAPGASAVPDLGVKSPFHGMSVAYKSNAARFCKAIPDGTVPGIISSRFAADIITYRQLKP